MNHKDLSIAEKLFPAFLPESTLVLGVIAIIIVGLLTKKSWVLGALSVGIYVLAAYFFVSRNLTEALFGGQIMPLTYAPLLQSLFMLGGVLTCIWSLTLDQSENSGGRCSEFFALVMSVVLGACLLVETNNMLVIYLAVELMSLSSYALVFLGHKKKGPESGLKYLLYGAAVSAAMLYGMSLLYGANGMLDLPKSIKGSLPNGELFMLMGLMLFTGGILFKLAAAPFHFWAPDAYEGGAIPVISLLSVVPKISAAYLLLSLKNHLNAYHLENEMFDKYWLAFISVIAIASIVLGNLGAVVQTNIKRLLAYSGIAHVGFLLIPVLLPAAGGVMAFMIYALTYTIMSYGAFYAAGLSIQHAGSENILDYKGLGTKAPMIGVMMVIMMIALTGLPPTIGFTGKLFVLSALWDYDQGNTSMLTTLLVVALVSTVVSLFYYLKGPYYMFFKQHSSNINVNIGLTSRIVVVLITIPVLLLFLKMDWLVNIINHFTS